jgi:hypothetical protein
MEGKPFLFLNEGLFLRLDSTSTLQQIIQLALLSLQVRVPTDVFLSDENVRHAALAGDLFERILEGGAVVCKKKKSQSTTEEIACCSPS